MQRVAHWHTIVPYYNAIIKRFTIKIYIESDWLGQGIFSVIFRHNGVFSTNFSYTSNIMRLKINCMVAVQIVTAPPGRTKLQTTLTHYQRLITKFANSKIRKHLISTLFSTCSIAHSIHTLTFMDRFQVCNLAESQCTALHMLNSRAQTINQVGMVNTFPFVPFSLLSFSMLSAATIPNKLNTCTNLISL